MTNVSFLEAIARWTAGKQHEQRLASRPAVGSKDSICYLVADEYGFLSIQSADFHPLKGTGWAAPISIPDILTIWSVE